MTLTKASLRLESAALNCLLRDCDSLKTDAAKTCPLSIWIEALCTDDHGGLKQIRNCRISVIGESDTMNGLLPLQQY